MAKAKGSNNTPEVLEVETKENVDNNDFEVWEVWDASSDKKETNNPMWLRLSKNGVILLSKPLRNELGDHIQIAVKVVNDKASVIRIKSATEDENGVIYIEKTKINAASLFKKYNIKVETLEKYEAVLNKENGCYDINLNK